MTSFFWSSASHFFPDESQPTNWSSNDSLYRNVHSYSLVGVNRQPENKTPHSFHVGDLHKSSAQKVNSKTPHCRFMMLLNRFILTFLTYLRAIRNCDLYIFFKLRCYRLCVLLYTIVNFKRIRPFMNFNNVVVEFILWAYWFMVEYI